jgi:hypothetical protein
MSKPPKAVSTEERFARIVRAFRNRDRVTLPSGATESKKAFGSSALKVNDKIFAFVASR